MLHNDTLVTIASSIIKDLQEVSATGHISSVFNTTFAQQQPYWSKTCQITLYHAGTHTDHCSHASTANYASPSFGHIY